MFSYSKAKYDALCAFYDALEQGNDPLTAAEYATKRSEQSDDLTRTTTIFTVVPKLFAHHITLSPYLLEQTVSALKIFCAIPENVLPKYIPSAIYLTEFSRSYQKIAALLEEQYAPSIFER